MDLTGNGLDASATPILSTIKTDGNKNILEFSIFMEAGISTNDVAGVLVFVDDVYIPKTGSATGDNLIKDWRRRLQNRSTL
ncbi:MAG: hypothetical protein IPP71_08925 [Bacteroidetes bacterium]|nr:hypothetical protein [Bacteroidota bacterium]